MDRQEFKDLIGEDPEDMFGPDWNNTVAELEMTPEDIKKTNIKCNCPKGYHDLFVECRGY